MEISSILFQVQRINTIKKKFCTRIFKNNLYLQYLTHIYICTHGEKTGQIVHPMPSFEISLKCVNSSLPYWVLRMVWNCTLGITVCTSHWWIVRGLQHRSLHSVCQVNEYNGYKSNSNVGLFSSNANSTSVTIPVQYQHIACTGNFKARRRVTPT